MINVLLDSLTPSDHHIQCEQELVESLHKVRDFLLEFPELNFCQFLIFAGVVCRGFMFFLGVITKF
jgi:hypothetical protein